MAGCRCERQRFNTDPWFPVLPATCREQCGIYCTVKTPGPLADPPLVLTVTFPVLAPVGTVAVT